MLLLVSSGVMWGIILKWEAHRSTVSCLQGLFKLVDSYEIVLKDVCWHWTAEVWMAEPGSMFLSLEWEVTNKQGEKLESMC